MPVKKEIAMKRVAFIYPRLCIQQNAKYMSAMFFFFFFSNFRCCFCFAHCSFALLITCHRKKSTRADFTRALRLSKQQHVCTAKPHRVMILMMMMQKDMTPLCLTGSHELVMF